MKKSTLRLSSPARLIVTGTLLVCGFGAVSTFSTDAQARNQARQGNRRRGITQRMLTAIQEKTGKPVSPEVRQKLTDSAKLRDDAIEAANEKFAADLAAATGLTVDQAKEIATPARGANGAAGAAGAAGGGRRNRGAQAPAPAAPATP